jgi:sulfur carrier protein
LQITVNGKEQIVEDADTIEKLLSQLQFEPLSVAVALDGNFVPRGKYATTYLEEDMDIEVLMPMQGG